MPRNFVDALAANVFGGCVFGGLLFELVARAFDGFDGGGFATLAAALKNFNCFVVVRVASVDEDLDVVSHDVFLLMFGCELLVKAAA